VSESYVNRALTVNKSLTEGLSVFLGTDLKKFDSIVNETNKFVKSTNEIWVGYIGTLGTSYDINIVSEAIKILKDKGLNNIKFVVVGDGPKRKNFEEYAKNLHINFEFTGMLTYEDMVKKLILCDIAVNPIIKGGASSIINKVGDYAAAGLPVINTQESIEYRKYVEDLQIGFNCEAGNPNDVANKIMQLYHDKKLRKQMGLNNRKFAEDKFDRGKTYFKIVKLIKNLTDS
jgi:glycosyltransferase involved in cell wall biosynthesis